MNPEDISRFGPLLERFAKINEKYGDKYPVILYEPEIDSEEKKALKDFIQKENSIELFSQFHNAEKFIQNLGVSFILIVSDDFDEKHVLQNFQSEGNVYGRPMFDFEEEALFNDMIESFSMKAYIFLTGLDVMMTKANVDENEEEVMEMCDLKEMTKEFQQEFIVLWYNPDVNTEKKEALFNKIDLEENNIYGDFKELHEKILKYNGPPYHLILTGKSEAEEIIKEIGDLKNLLCVYIYCDDAQLEKIKDPKIIVRKTFEELIPKIVEGIRTKSALRNTFPAFATDFDAMDKSHIYNLHYYLQGLINFKNRKQAKRDFISLARRIYQSKRIFEFEQEYMEYNQSEILKWYAKESPVYKLVNNCLRIATSDSILYCRYVLRDLEAAIREKYQEESHKFNGLVYRGAYITREEWEKLQNNIGKEIEMYGFLSTSQDLKTAKKFLTSDPQKKILITIVIPPLPMIPELTDQGFANLSSISGFKEAEILFNVRSKFRILEAGVVKINAQGQECRHLILFYGAQLLRKYMTKESPVMCLEPVVEEMKCNLCGSVKELFGLNQGIRCVDCVIKGDVPKDAPLVTIGEDYKEAVRNLKGKILEFNHQVTDFPYYGYECYNCQEMGKSKYYKWLSENKEEEVFEQCLDCFGGGKRIESCDILLIETKPYTFWHERQVEAEEVDDGYQSEISKLAKSESQSQSNVFMEVQRFDLCIEYEKKVIKKLNKKRWRETEKFKSFYMMGLASEKCGKHEQALRFHREILALRKMKYGDQSSWTGLSYTCLAFVYRSLGQYDQALDFFNRALEIAEKVYGEKHRDTVTCYNNLAATYCNLGQYQQALEYFTKALDMRKALFGDKHPLTATSFNPLTELTRPKYVTYCRKRVNNLAVAYKGLGQYLKSFEYFAKALNIRKAIYGDKHADTAISFDNIASVYENVGDYKHALEYHQKALEIFKAIYGEKHPTIATSYNGLASTSLRFSQHQQANEYFTKALETTKAIYGEKHQKVVTSLRSFAKVHESLKDYQKVLEYEMKALEVMKALYGDNHQEVGILYNKIAFVFESLGQYQQALEYFTTALDIAKALHGEKHPEIAEIYSDIASVYESLREDQQALDYFMKALEIRKAHFGEKHKLTVNSYRDIAFMHKNLGQHHQAIEYFEKTLEIMRDLYRETHQDTADLYNNTALIYHGLGDLQKALEYFTKTSEIRKVLYGENHAETASSLSNLAFVYRDLGENQQAIECFTRSLEIRKIVYGEESAQTATSYNSLASVYESLEDYQRALECYMKVLDIRKAVFGEVHQQTAALYESLALVYKKLGQQEKEEECFKKVLGILNAISEQQES